MRIVPPNRRDIADIAVAIQSFDGMPTYSQSLEHRHASGSVNAFGQYSPSADGVSLWMMISITKEEMADLWRYAGISTGRGSAYEDMLRGSNHILYVVAVKAKRFFLRERWAGNMFLLFDNAQLAIGSVGGDSQSDMWLEVRRCLDLEGRIFPDTASALVEDTSQMIKGGASARQQRTPYRAGAWTVRPKR